VAHLNWLLSRSSSSSLAPDGPADVEALSERVREAARVIGNRVRGGTAVPGFIAPDDSDPNHHLWKNGGRWWIAFTAHAGVAQERVRFSLGTTDLEVARARRDAVLRLFAEAEGLAISLRFKPSRRPGTGAWR